MRSFSDCLRRARELRGLSQSDLAARAKLQPSAVSHFETGTRRPSLDNLRRLANALEVSADMLLGRAPGAMTRRETIGFVINLSGVKGKGPWITSLDPTTILRVAHAYKNKDTALIRCGALSASYPSARVLRLVRRSKLDTSAEERAVVEAAMAYQGAIDCEPLVAEGQPWRTTMDALLLAVRALRAKRGGR